MIYEVALFELAIVKRSIFNYFIENIGCIAISYTEAQRKKRKTTFVIGMKVLSVF